MASERAVSAVDARPQMSKPRADMASSKSRAIINSSSTIRARWRRGDEHWAMVSPYSFLAVLPLVKQIASLCVPAQREEICIGMSAGGRRRAIALRPRSPRPIKPRVGFIPKRKPRRVGTYRGLRSSMRRWLSTADHEAIRYLETSTTIVVHAATPGEHRTKKGTDRSRPPGCDRWECPFHLA